MSAALMSLADPEGSACLGYSQRQGMRPVRRKQVGFSRRSVLALLAVVMHVAAVFGFLQCRPAKIAEKAPEMVMVALTDLPVIPEEYAPPMPKNLQPASIAVQMPAAVALLTTAEPVTGAAQIPSPATAAATPPSIKAAWASRVLQHLERLKRYPHDAVLQHAEGVVMLHFTIDRSGQVLRAWIEKSSGYDALDDEALALVHRAAPLPMPPESLHDEVFDLAVPISFSLNR